MYEDSSTKIENGAVQLLILSLGKFHSTFWTTLLMLPDTFEISAQMKMHFWSHFWYERLIKWWCTVGVELVVCGTFFKRGKNHTGKVRGVGRLGQSFDVLRQLLLHKCGIMSRCIVIQTLSLSSHCSAWPSCRTGWPQRAHTPCSICEWCSLLVGEVSWEYLSCFPEVGWGWLMSFCLESQGCHLIPLSCLLSHFFA